MSWQHQFQNDWLREEFFSHDDISLAETCHFSTSSIQSSLCNVHTKIIKSKLFESVFINKNDRWFYYICSPSFFCHDEEIRATRDYAWVETDQDIWTSMIGLFWLNQLQLSLATINGHATYSKIGSKRDKGLYKCLPVKLKHHANENNWIITMNSSSCIKFVRV